MNQHKNEVKKVEVEKVEVEVKVSPKVAVCPNCENSGKYCSVCSNPTVE